MTSRPPALLVCQAGAGVGLGHLTRILVAGAALRDRLGTEVHLLIQGEPVDRLELTRFRHQFVSSTASLGTVIVDIASAIRPWLVVFDLHPQRIPMDLALVLESLRRSGCNTVGIDGFLQFRNQLDLVFLPSLRSDDQLAEGPGTPVVYGEDCFLIPESQRGQAWEPGLDLLVLTGGADATGLGLVWPTSLDEGLQSNVRIQWVRGPFAKMPKIPLSARLQWTVHHAPSDLQAYMASVNYGLCVFGVSFFELLKMGVPTVVFSPYGDKDYLDLNYIESSGLALVAKNELDAIEKVLSLMSDAELAIALTRRAKRLFIQDGGARLSDLVAEWYRIR